MNTTELKLLFVYNANDGLFNTMADFAHKILSPSTYRCRLCALTYDNFFMKNEWKIFVSNLSVPAFFLHKNEFLKRFSSLADLPAIFILNDGKINILMSRNEIDDCYSLDELKAAVTQKVERYVQHYHSNV